MKRFRALALLVTLLLVTAACGTRLPDSAFENAEGTNSPGTGGGNQSGTKTGAGTATGTGTSGTGATGGAQPGAAGGTDPGATGGGGSGDAGAAAAANHASDVGITPDSIVLGTIVAENGVLGDAFAPAARGLRAWANAINAAGGINGRQVVLKTCDDHEDRSRALECARQLVEGDQVFALVGTNTRAMGGAAQYLNDQGVPVMGMPITNSFYRYPHFWSGYPNGYAKDGNSVGGNNQLVSQTGQYRWFKQTLGVSKAAVIAYDIDESQQAGNFMVEGLKREGYQVSYKTVSFAAPSFDSAVAQMQDEGVQIIFDAMDDGANRKLCDTMARRKMTVVAKVSTVVSMGDAVGTAYNDTCRNSVYIPTQSVPYTAANIPEVAAFRDAYSTYQPGLPFHQWALEAWAQAQTVADGIRSMGPAPTRAGLEDFLRSMQKYNENGVFVGLDYNRDQSTPTTEDCFGIAHWDDSQGGWVEATGSFPFCYPDAQQYSTPALELGN